MVQGCPAVRVQRVEVGVAISDDSIQRNAFLRSLGEDGLVDGSLTSDAHSIVDQLTAVYQVLEVLMVALVGRSVQILQDCTRVLVSADLERSLSVAIVYWIGTHVHHVSTRFKVTIVAGDVEGCILVLVEKIKRIFGQSADALLEILPDIVVLYRVEQMLKVFNDER